MISKKQFEKLAGVKRIRKEGKTIYYGDLDLSFRSDIKELPDNLKAKSLNISYSNITKLPKGLDVENLLNISNTRIKELPEDTKFGELHANSMERAFSFPKIVHTKTDLYCTSTIIKQMPKEIYCGEVCDFSDSKFYNLPKVFDFNFSLYLKNTNVTEIPEYIKEVYGSLDIRNTLVSNLTNNLVVYYCDFENTLINELSEGFIVGKVLDLFDIELKDYSNLHKVCSTFIVRRDKYEEIKDNLFQHTIEIENNGKKIIVTFEPNYKGAYLFENENGRYIKASRIFGKIVEQKDNLYRVYTKNRNKTYFLLTDGEGNWEYGETFREAKRFLIQTIQNMFRNRNRK